MFERGILKEEDIAPLAEGVLKVLERVGILCQNEEMLKALEVKGAKVDYATQRATFPPEMVKEYVETFRGEGREEDKNGKFRTPELPRLGTQVAPFFYDYERKEKRRGNKKDFITLIKLGDILHPEKGVGHCLNLTDVPPLLEPLEAALILAEYAHKPNAAFAWNVNQIDYLIEMGEIIGIKDWFSWGAICFAHPLRFDKEVADKFVRRVKCGYPTGLTSMAVAGVSTPVTLEGYIIVASAEHVATWISARAINPQVPLRGSMWGGTVDMRTGEVSYSSFDAMLYAFATVEFLRRWCGINLGVGGGEYCDAKLPGLFAALEKAYKAMVIAAFTGYHPPVGGGMLEEGKTLSPVQLLLERELGKGLRYLSGEIDIKEINPALEAILEVGLGLNKSYLEIEHTLKNFRHSLWSPQIWDRTGWKGFEWEEEILNKVQEEINSLLSQYRKPEVEEEKISQLRKVIEKAKRHLLHT